MSRSEKRPCVDCGRLCFEHSTPDEHEPGCYHATVALTKAEQVVVRVQAYAKYLRGLPLPASGDPSLGPLFDAGVLEAAHQISDILTAIIDGDEEKLKKLNVLVLMNEDVR